MNSWKKQSKKSDFFLLFFNFILVCEMKRVVVVFVVMIWFLVLVGCGESSKTEMVNEKPELAPICPEGYYWLDTIKSCAILEDDMLE